METQPIENVEAAKPKTLARLLPWFLVAWIGVAYWFLPGLVFTVVYMSTIIVFREHIRGLLLMGIALLFFTILPSWLFWFVVSAIILCIPHNEMPLAYQEFQRRLEIYLTEVAIDQSIIQMRQLGMRLTSTAIKLDYARMMHKDGDPAYYRRVRANLRKLMLTVMRLRETTPKDLWRGLDFRVMDEISKAVIDVEIKADRKATAA